jgi:hypothetical protein
VGGGSKGAFQVLLKGVGVWGKWLNFSGQRKSDARTVHSK